MIEAKLVFSSSKYSASDACNRCLLIFLVTFGYHDGVRSRTPALYDQSYAKNNSRACCWRHACDGLNHSITDKVS
jgi:hypothetical protein